MSKVTIYLTPYDENASLLLQNKVLNRSKHVEYIRIYFNYNLYQKAIISAHNIFHSTKFQQAIM